MIHSADAAFFHVREGWLRDSSAPMFSNSTAFFNMQPRNDSALLYVSLHIREQLVAMFRFNGYGKYLSMEINSGPDEFNAFLLLSDPGRRNNLILYILNENLHRYCLAACNEAGLSGDIVIVNGADLSAAQAAAVKSVSSINRETPIDERKQRLETFFEQMSLRDTR